MFGFSQRVGWSLRAFKKGKCVRMPVKEGKKHVLLNLGEREKKKKAEAMVINFEGYQEVGCERFKS